MLKNIIIACVSVLTIAAIVIGSAAYQATKIPAVNAKAFISSKHDPSKKIAVIMGDSITHGAVSYDYIRELSGDRELGNYIFINEGINSRLAYNLLGQADDVIKTRPDEIFILIGTNDCIASLSDLEYERYKKTWNLPARPTKEWFAANLESLINKLKSNTAARITLISIPPISEKTNSVPFVKSVEYARVIRDTAQKLNAGYIGLNELLTADIIKKGGATVEGFSSDRRAMFYAIALHYLLMRSWDEISDRQGFLFLTDHVHLNSRGGHLLKTKIKETLLPRQ